jgi:hypothetical protein
MNFDNYKGMNYWKKKKNKKSMHSVCFSREVFTVFKLK